MTNKKLLAELKKSLDRIGKERDRLRSMSDEIDGLKGCCERAYYDLESAIDSLSELV